MYTQSIKIVFDFALRKNLNCENYCKYCIFRKKRSK